MSKNQKFVVENKFQKPIILCIEPWATEYGMMPDEKFEIVTNDEADNFYFHLVFENERIAIFVEGAGTSHPQIYQDGELLDYGHNSF
mgnify:CR=1 FL=1